jgi:hypothetical protein
MNRIILVYGIVSGVIIIGSAIWGAELAGESVAALEYLGYLIMLIALSVVFIGIKKYRDKELGGVITFGTAVLVGLGISIVASVIYVAAWEIYLAQTDYAFIDDYIAATLANEQAAGVTDEELQAIIGSMEVIRQQYSEPLYRLGMTFLEIFPVGLLITLVSAAILRRSDVLPAQS